MVRSSPKEKTPTLYKLIDLVFVTAYGGVFGAVLAGIAGMVIGGQLAINSQSQAQVLFSFINPN